MKLLIVDDEKRICALIENLINWTQLNLQGVGFAHSGQEAYEKALENHPDIIITDIRMPEGDGLNMISRVKNELPDVKFIVISGYKEFDLVHRAIKLGVEDFLLKPIQKEELNATLSRICNRCVQEHNEFLFNDSAANSRDRCRFITALLKSGWGENSWTLLDINRNYKYHFREGGFQVVFIKIHHPDFPQKTYIDFLSEVSGHCRQILSPYCCDLEYNFSQDGNIHFIINYEYTQFRKIDTAVQKAFYCVENFCFRSGVKRFVMGVGWSFKQINLLPQSLYTALYAAKSCLRLGHGKLYLASNMLPRSYAPANLSNFLDSTFQQAVSKCVEFQSSEELRQLILAKLAEQEKYFQEYPGILFDLLSALITLFYSCIANAKLLSSYSASNQAALLKLLDNSFSANEIIPLILNSMSEELTQIQSMQGPRQHYAISVAKRYIRQNYQHQITLETLATLTYMNPIYLSVLFKKETGENFSSYLQNVRIENAKKFLKDMRYSVSQVAEMVGFSDSKYFSKLFYKTTGMRPKEFRQLCNSNLE